MIVITGASEGLGKELAELYIRDGKRVIGLSRQDCGEGVEHMATDLSQVADITAAAERIKADAEPLEALVHCAGILSVEKIEGLTDQAVSMLLDVDLKAPMLLTSALMEKIRRDGADIVNVSSTVGLKGAPDQAAYSAAKWGMRGLSAYLQLELKDYPSRVISFCPGAFKTDIFIKATGTDNSASKGAMMSAKDVAQCLKQLLELPKNMGVSEIIVNRKQAKA